jgi:16S rRNA processing protein RimM
MIGEVVKIGRIGRTHGFKGELKISVEEAYQQDALACKSLLVAIGGQYIPHFVQYLRGTTNMLLKLEEVNDKEAASVFQQKDLYLRANQVTVAPEEEEDSLADWIGLTIVDEHLGVIGPITDVFDLPQQFLAEVSYQAKTVMIPLHEDLILAVDPEKGEILMDLPEGLLELE